MSTPTFDLSGLINGLTAAFNSFIGILGQVLPIVVVIGVVGWVVKKLVDTFRGATALEEIGGVGGIL